MNNPMGAPEQIFTKLFFVSYNTNYMNACMFLADCFLNFPDIVAPTKSLAKSPRLFRAKGRLLQVSLRLSIFYL